VAGAHLHDLAWGRDPRPVVPVREEKSVGAEETFAVDVHDLTVVESKVLELADRCATRLRAQGLAARTVSIKVRTSDFRTLTRSRTLAQPSDVGREIYLAARGLLSAVDLAGLPVRLIGVRTEGLVPAGEVVRQLTLDEAVTDNADARRDAERAVDLVRERFGEHVIGAGTRAVGRTAARAETPAGAERAVGAEGADGTGGGDAARSVRATGGGPVRGGGAGAGAGGAVRGAGAGGPVRGAGAGGARGVHGAGRTDGAEGDATALRPAWTADGRPVA
jgi:DNA polymerase-4